MVNTGRLAGSFGVLLLVSAGCGGGGDDSPAPTRTATVAPTATASTAQATATATAKPAAPTASLTSSPLPSATPSATPSVSPTPTPRPPEVTYLGIARADDLVQTTTLVDAQGRPIFQRIQGQAMSIVLEARHGTARLDDSAYDPLGGAPAAQMLVSRPLGDGSLAVCDYAPPLIGGVPGVDPPLFSDDPMVVGAINDLGCRVNDGTGVPRGRPDNNACTHDESFEYTFVEPDSELQFCLPIDRTWAFPPGDTIVAARVRDVNGLVSAPREIVVRVAGETPFGCENGLGERMIRPQDPDAVLLTSATPGGASRGTWVSDPIRICAGPDVGDGVHVLALRSDATIGIPLTDASTLCVRLSARGSDGILDCDGGTAHDVRAVQMADGATPLLVEGGLGLNAGTGAASLRIPVGLRQLPVGSSPSDCAAQTEFPFDFQGVLTTANGTAVVVDDLGHANAILSQTGVAFDCAQWRSGGPGSFVLPFAAVDTVAGDVAAALVLTE